MWMRENQNEKENKNQNQNQKENENENEIEIELEMGINEYLYLKYFCERYNSLYHNNLNELIQNELKPKKIQKSIILTLSSLKSKSKNIEIKGFNIEELNISEFDNEKDFKKKIKDILGIFPQKSNQNHQMDKKNQRKKIQISFLIIHFTPTRNLSEKYFINSNI
ncbi:hypothetical protein M0811_12313 [Anaeramoeba ignava]|uniref:Uncharacterized protein n=1 Tax=Anaeramoeba ignava TaxID=1746090 RepID=A0A9Q0LBP5_ANAIG|nr:hypothetical protein M0811_12313 [Anaeramoeba ignava]